MAGLPQFPISTQTDPYWEIPMYDAAGNPLSIEGRVFEAWIAPALTKQGVGEPIKEIKVLTFQDGLSLVPPTDGSGDQTVKNTLVHQVSRAFAQANFPRGDLTADLLEVVNGSRRLFAPVRLFYADPAQIREFVADRAGITFGQGRQPIVTPVAIAGQAGRRGSGFLTGTLPPQPSDGEDGDYWVVERTGQSNLVYGPKEDGEWPPQPSSTLGVGGVEDVPGLPGALAEKADLVATGMALGGKAAAGVNSDIAELRGLSAPIPEAGLPAGEKYGILRGLTGQASADASGPLQAFFDALRVQGGVGVLPIGTVALKTAAVSTTGLSPFTMRGAGRDLSKVLRAGPFGTPISVTGAIAVAFEDFTLDAGNDAFPTGSNHAFNLSDCIEIAFRRMRVRNWKNSPILVTSSAVPGTSKRIIYDDVLFDGLDVANNGAFFGGADECFMHLVRVIGCPGNPGYALQLKGVGKYCAIDNCYAEDCAGGAAFGQDTATPSVYMARVNGLTLVRCRGGLLAGYASFCQFSNVLIDATGLATAVGIRLENSQGITCKNITIKGIPASANSYAVRLDNCTDCEIEIDLLDNVPNTPIVFTGSSARNTVTIRKISNSNVSNLFSDQSTGVGTNKVIYQAPAPDTVEVFATTSDNVATTLTKDGAAATAANSLVLSPGRTRSFVGRLLARAANNSSAYYEIKACARRGSSASAIVLVGVPTVTKVFGDGSSGWPNPTVSLNTTLGSLEFKVAGLAAGDAINPITWKMHVDTFDA